jgi:integrase
MKVSISEGSYRDYRYRVNYPKGGKRASRWFVYKKDAEAFVKEAKRDLRQRGAEQSPITPSEQRALDTFRELVSKIPNGAEHYTLQDAVDLFAKRLSVEKKTITCNDLAASLLTKIESECGEGRHLNSRRNELKRFNEVYGDWFACDISKDILEDFISNLKTIDRRKPFKGMPRFNPKPLGNNSKLAYRTMLIQLFTHALDIGAVENNPAKKTTKLKYIKPKVSILKPKQVAELFQQASDELIPVLAISFFAGLRYSEAIRMNWSDIDIKRSRLIVPEDIAKKERKRIVTISDNLKQWLLPHAKHEGRMIASEGVYRARLQAAREAAGIKAWGKERNPARHSFGTYHYALHENLNKTAKEMGHIDTRVTHDRYVTSTPCEEAEAFWSIHPVDTTDVINIAAG